MCQNESLNLVAGNFFLEAKIFTMKGFEIYQNGILGHIKAAGGENFGNDSFRNVSEWKFGHCCWNIWAISKPPEAKILEIIPWPMAILKSPEAKILEMKAIGNVQPSRYLVSQFQI